jgi:hypothetical protein
MAPSSQTSVLSPPLAVNLNLANYSDWKLKLFRPFISFLALKLRKIHSLRKESNIIRRRNILAWIEKCENRLDLPILRF